MSTVFDQFRTVPLSEAIEANKNFEKENIFLFERDPLNVPPQTVMVVDNVDALTDSDMHTMVRSYMSRSPFGSVAFTGFEQQGRIIGAVMYDGPWFYYYNVPVFLFASEKEAKVLCKKLNQKHAQIQRERHEYWREVERYEEKSWLGRLFAKEPVKPT